MLLALLTAVGVLPSPNQRPAPPAPVHGIYVNAWAFGTRRFQELVRLADSTRINAFVVDVKDDTGYLTYKSEVPTALEIGANRQLRAPDAAARVALLKAHGIRPIARIVVAKDPLLAEKKPAGADLDRGQPPASGARRRGTGGPPQGARHPADRPDRRREGSASRREETCVGGSRYRRRPVDRPQAYALGRRVQRLGLGVRLAAGGRGGADGLRGDPVRLRPIPRRAEAPPRDGGVPGATRRREQPRRRETEPDPAR